MTMVEYSDLFHGFHPATPKAKSAAATPKESSKTQGVNTKEGIEETKSFLKECGLLDANGVTNHTSALANVRRIQTKDLLPATALLASTIRAIPQRNQDFATKPDTLLHHDPVQEGLWALTMKLRDGSEHADELLETTTVIDDMLAIMTGCPWGWYETFQKNSKEGRSIRKLSLVLQRKKGMDVRKHLGDICSALAVLHELCRYRSGCLALSQHSRCLAFLMELPLDNMNALVMDLVSSMELVMSTAFKKDRIDWCDPYNYSMGMQEQAIIDILGRVLNGLDQHTSLRKKTAKLIRSRMSSLHRIIGPAHLFFSNKFMREELGCFHCVDITGSLARLRQLLSAILDGKKSPKVWKSKFRLDRMLVSREKEKSTDGGHQKVATSTGSEKCHGCRKDLTTIFQCSKW